MTKGPRRTRLFAVAVAVSLLFAASACSAEGDSAAGGEADGIKLVKDGNLSVCTHLSYKPFEYKDAAGKVVGFDMDLANLVSKKLGLETDIVDIDFAPITSGAVFAAKKCDIAMGAITITKERQQAVSFSTPYFSATQALLVKGSSGIKDLPDLKGKTLGVQTDTTGQIYADKNADANGYKTIVFDDFPTELTSVQSGKADAIINDNGPLYDYAKENPQFAVVKEFDTGEQYGFVGQKDNENATKLMGVVDEAFTTAIKDGTYTEIYKTWFGAEPEVLPSPAP